MIRMSVSFHSVILPPLLLFVASSQKAHAVSYSYVYKGCYQDTEPRTFPLVAPDKLTTSSGTGSIYYNKQTCGDYCSSKGYQYFGLQKFNQCWCGNSMLTQKLSDGDCNYACPSDPFNSCGSEWKNSVYERVVADVYANVNLALQGVATQSTNYPQSGYEANVAIDGRLESYSHTNNNSPNWWMVDLGAGANKQYTITGVSVYQRSDYPDCCKARINWSDVEVLNSSGNIVATKTIRDVQQWYTFNFGGVQGRYVRIMRVTGGTSTVNDYLHLAEVQVMGFNPNPADVNLALQGVATQSSIYGYEANRAIDGSMESYSHTNFVSGVPSWWMVDLGAGANKQYTITGVLVYNRSDFAARIKASDVQVLNSSGDIVATKTIRDVQSVYTFNFGGVQGRYVRIQRVTVAVQGFYQADYYLHVSEVQVMGFNPTPAPTPAPTAEPTPEPITAAPTAEPTPKPITAAPTAEPTPKPITAAPTAEPTPEPITAAPTAEPTPEPMITAAPTAEPTPEPITAAPTAEPTPKPITTAPTAEPTPKPITTAPTAAKQTTSAQTAAPAMKPTSTSIESWDLNYASLSTNFNKDSESEITLNYNIGKARNHTVSVFKKGCKDAITPAGVVTHKTSTSSNSTDSSLDNLQVLLDLNKAAISSSNIWNGEFLQMCVKVDLFSGSKANVIKTDERDVAINLDFGNNFTIVVDEMDQISLGSNNESTKVENYIEACTCDDATSFACITNSLSPNDYLNVCIRSLSEEMEIDYLDKLTMTSKDDGDEFVIVQNKNLVDSTISSKTKVLTKNGVHVASVIPSNFFSYSDTSSANVTGVVYLKLKGSRRRLAVDVEIAGRPQVLAAVSTSTRALQTESIGDQKSAFAINVELEKNELGVAANGASNAMMSGFIAVVANVIGSAAAMMM